MKRVSLLVMVLMLGFCGQAVNAQDVTQTLTPEEQLLVLQKRVEASKPASVETMNEFATQFGSACKSFLTTFDEGTTITIDRLNQFMGTNAGKMTIFFIAWKLMSKDVMTISSELGQTVLGILLLIPYFLFVNMIYRSFITGKRVLVKKDGKIKTYALEKPVAESLNGESYGWWAFITSVSLMAYTIILLVLIF
jgi:hypothetical protein